MANHDKMGDIKLDDMQITTNKVTSSSGNKNDSDIDDCISDAAKNKHYELVEARNRIKFIQHVMKITKPRIDRHPAKPKNYDEWTDEERYKHIIENAKSYTDLPDSLLFFIRGAIYRGDCGQSSTSKPSWLDMDKFRRGQKFVRDHLLSITFSNLLSLFQIFAFVDGLKPLILTRQSHTPYLAFKRYNSTMRRILNWMTEDPWTEGTQAHKDIQAVRKMHRAVRLKLCEHDDEQIDAATKIPNPWCPDREMILEDFSSSPCPINETNCLHLLFRPKGLNQSEMAATQFAFCGMIILYPREFGVHVNEEDIEAFCHTWRGIGYLLGIEDEYNFCRGNLEETRQRGRDFIEYWVRPYLQQVTPEWEHMLRCVTVSFDSIMMGNNMKGDNIFKISLLLFANLLNIDMPRVRSTLTYFQRLYLILIRFMLRYAMKIRCLRKYINSIIFKMINKTMKFDPERSRMLKEMSNRKVPDPFQNFPLS